MATETQVVIARHLGMSGRHLRDLRDREIIPDPRDKKVTIDAIRLAYIAHLRSQAGRWSTDNPNALNLQGERARLASAQANKLERDAALENAETLNVHEQLDADAVYDTAIRSRVLALGVRLCQEVAAEGDAIKVCAIIDEAVNEALEAIQAEAAA